MGPARRWLLRGDVLLFLRTVGVSSEGATIYKPLPSDTPLRAWPLCTERAELGAVGGAHRADSSAHGAHVGLRGAAHTQVSPGRTHTAPCKHL